MVSCSPSIGAQLPINRIFFLYIYYTYDVGIYNCWIIYYFMRSTKTSFDLFLFGRCILFFFHSNCSQMNVLNINVMYVPMLNIPMIVSIFHLRVIFPFHPTVCFYFIFFGLWYICPAQAFSFVPVSSVLDRRELFIFALLHSVVESQKRR